MKTERRIVVNGLDTITFIPFDDILYFQATGNHCEIFTNDGKSIVWCKRIGDVLKDLEDSRFVKISQSAIINKGYLKIIHKKTKQVELIFKAIKIPYSLKQKDILRLC